MRLFPLVAALSILAACGPDLDGDGVGRRDCDDANPSVSPRAEEVCNGVDDDCDGFVDEGVSLVAWWDRDGDGFGDDAFVRRVCEMPADGAAQGGDCDDLDARVWPGAEEACNGVDDDCDGEIDQGLTATFFADADGDGHGGPEGETVVACAPPPGFAWTDDDCDDADASSRPGGVEVCDDADNDCDGQIDDDALPGPRWEDADGDGFGAPERPRLGCGPGLVANALDCDDADAARSPASLEQANGEDDDCDGWVDEIVVTEGLDVQAVVDAAADGSVVQLDRGIFYGTVDLRGRELVLAGAGCDASVIYADGAGSALVIDGGEVVDLSVAGGSAEQGGGVLVEGSARLREVCVESSVATDRGGGIAVTQGHLDMDGGRVARCAANGAGGGIYVGFGATATLTGVALLANTADSGGGAAAQGGELRLRATVVAANRSRRNGGGLAALVMQANESTLPTLLSGEHLTLVANAADGYGQALYAWNAEMVVSDSIFAHHAREAIKIYPQFTPPSTASLRLERVGWWGNPGRDQRAGVLGGALRADPRFLAFDPIGDPLLWDLRLGLGSPLIDAGAEGLDADGTPGDLGAYGGPFAPEGSDWGYASDLDADGLPDGWEQQSGGSPWADDAALDRDADGLSATAELGAGTRPDAPDTDADGVGDGDELSAGSDPVDPRDHAPFAHAGADRWVRVGAPASLDGVGSFDLNGDALSFEWTLSPPPGASGAIQTPSAERATLIPPSAGVWTAHLRVSDAGAADTDSVEIHALNGAIVPDDYPTLAEAHARVPSGDAIFLRAGEWPGLDLAGRSRVIVGLEPGVVLRGDGEGPVLRAAAGERLELVDLSVTGGAAERGGGVLIEGGSLRVVRARLFENRATSGGAVYAADAPVEVIDSVIEGNQAAQSGGGLEVVDGDLRMLRSAVRGNRADAAAGGANVHGGAQRVHTLTNTTFQANSAPVAAALRLSAADSSLTWTHGAILEHVGQAQVIEVNDGRFALVSTVTAWNEAEELVSRPATRGNLAFVHTLHDEPVTPLHLGPDALGGEPGTVLAPPRFAVYSRDGDPSNDLLAPAAGSPLIDAGDPEARDGDRSLADIGPTGGPQAERGAHLWARDRDGDGLIDAWELHHGLDPLSPDADADPDGDGLSSAEEQAAGTDPRSEDTDADGVSDADELAEGTDPTVAGDQRPSAVAPARVSGREGALVLVEGGESFDPNGDPLAYRWRLVEGPAGSTLNDGALEGADRAQVRFVPDLRGIYRLELVVSDGRVDSLPARVQVVAAGTVRVPEQVASLDAAIAGAIEGDEIVLGAGRFVGAVARPGLALSLRGQGPDQTLWEARAGLPHLTLAAGDAITLAGLTLSGGVGPGGAVVCEDAALTASEVNFRGNAGQNGGAIWARDCAIELQDVEVAANQAAWYGGGVFVEGGSLRWEGGAVVGNVGGGGGGGLYLLNAESWLSGLLLAGNQTPSTGGAAYQRGGTVYADHLSFRANRGRYGAWWVTAGRFVLTDSIVAEGDDYGVYEGSEGRLEADRVLWWANKNGPAFPSSRTSVGTHLFEDPRFLAADDPRLAHDSPARDAGAPDCRDPDDSRCDLGAFAGAHAPPGFDAGYVDVDDDGLPDRWAAHHGLSGPDDDLDGDGLSAIDELGAGTDPTRADTDGDGIDDGDELSAGTDPAEGDRYRPEAAISAVDVGDPGQTLTLDGRDSSDPDGDTLSWRWRLIAWPGRSSVGAGALSQTTSDRARLVPDAAGAWVVELVVDDGFIASRAVTHTVRVRGDLAVPEDYPDLASAVAAASSGATLRLGPGGWAGGAVATDLTLTIEGAGVESTWIEGGFAGPGLTVRGGELTLRDLEWLGGVAARGASLDVADATLRLERVALRGGRAALGGCVHATRVELVATDAAWTDCVASSLGGGLYLESSSSEIRRSLFAGNVAADQGGAVYALYGSVEIENAVLSDNRARYGGALNLAGTRTLPLDAHLANLTATFNTGVAGGAFLRISLADVELTDSVLAHHRGAETVWQLDSTSGTLDQRRTLLWDSASAHYRSTVANPIGRDGNAVVDPRLWDVSEDGDWTNDDWRLKPSSPARDAGLGLDADGTPADLGAFGGPAGDW